MRAAQFITFDRRVDIGYCQFHEPFSDGVLIDKLASIFVSNRRHGNTDLNFR